MPTEKYRWHFELVGPMGGATGSAFTNTLSGAGRPPEVELAREAIQNSADATLPGERTKVIFRIVTLNGNEKENLVKTLCLVEGFEPRIDRLNLSEECWLKKKEKPLQLTFIEDFNTEGLNGEPHAPNSNFFKLLLSLGDISKTVSDIPTGGSYGYGKAALSMNSMMRTIVAYSRFEDENSCSASRLMSCAYFDSHEYDGQQYTGRAWLGKKVNLNEQIVISPLENDEADELATNLNFMKREENDTGTSIMILDSNNDSEKLLRGIEMWWWPKIIDNEIEVKVQLDEKTLFPKPKSSSDLAPFIECYDVVTGAAEPTGPHIKRDKLNRRYEKNRGSYCFKILDDIESQKMNEDLIGCVAMMRIPKMIVDYKKMARSSPPAIGIFIADPDVDEILKFSEPPTHDRWDAESARLRIAEPDEATAKAIVKSIYDNLKQNMRKFQSDVEPPMSPDKHRIRTLEKILGKLFSTRFDHGGDGRESYPIVIEYRDGPIARSVIEEGQTKLKTEAKVAIKLRDNEEDDRKEGILHVRVALLEDDSGKEGDLVPIDIEFERGNESVEETESEEEERIFKVNLSKDDWIVFSLKSSPYDMTWATKIVVEIEPQRA